jgi:hypothetical protein
MSKFIVGHQVRVVFAGILPGNSIGPNVTNGEIGIVKESYICKCGEEHLDIGLRSKLTSVTCYKCREDLPGSDSVHWCHSSRFELVN